jgi:hypothetical protein
MQISKPAALQRGFLDSVVSRQAAATTGCTSPTKKTAPVDRTANWLLKGSFFKGPLSRSQVTVNRHNDEFLCPSTV